ncbi:hypothetical protein LENED_011313 [Lentinula edodes]|uniref:Uncharacterized protein n=1 Tax=Lentinula edodes TaxID=5353 RepID=A0A1Q3EPP8_LENED|nr:hypothetical protein LENED_011313 [Lentinula edodes]
MYTLSAEPSTFVIHNFICSFAETNTPYITGHWLCYVVFTPLSIRTHRSRLSEQMNKRRMIQAVFISHDALMPVTGPVEKQSVPLRKKNPSQE